MSIAQVALVVTVAGVTGAFPHGVPGTKTSITGAEVFIFLALLMNGPAAAALAAAAEAAVGSYRTSTRWTSRIGSPAQAGLAMYACGTLFGLGEECVQQRFGQPSLFTQLLLLLPLAVCYFATGTLLTASLFTLKQKQPLHPWKILKGYSWLAIVYMTSAAVAALLYVGYERLGIGVFLAALPVIAGVMLTHRLYVRHIEDTKLAQQQRIATAEREADEAARHLAELQKSESRFQKAFAHAAIGMALVTQERMVLQAIPRAVRDSGAPCGRADGRRLRAFVHRDDHAALAIELDNLLSGSTGTCSLELCCTRPDRAVVTVALHAYRSSPPPTKTRPASSSRSRTSRRAESRKAGCSTSRITTT